MSYSLNSFKGGYKGDYIGGLLKGVLRGILGVQTGAHISTHTFKDVAVPLVSCSCSLHCIFFLFCCPFDALVYVYVYLNPDVTASLIEPITQNPITLNCVSRSVQGNGRSTFVSARACIALLGKSIIGVPLFILGSPF